MKIGVFRAWFLSAVLALTGLAIAFPFAAHAQPFGGAEHAQHHNKHVNAGMHSPHAAGFAWHAAEKSDCGNGLIANAHGGCGASMSGCCTLCSLLPPEFVAALPGATPTLGAVNAEAAEGIPPDRLKRPPRLSL